MTATPAPTLRNNRVGLYSAHPAIDVAGIGEDVDVERLADPRAGLDGERGVRLAERLGPGLRAAGDGIEARRA